MEVDQAVDVFVGEADDCERMVACLQYIAFLSPDLHFSTTVCVSLLEKGVLYRGMIDLHEFSLLDQSFYITQKFSEFGERSAALNALRSTRCLNVF